MLMPVSNKQKISRFFAGETIFEEGQSGSVMYCIVQGLVEISISRGNHRVVVEELSSGAYFGELSILLDLPRRTTAVASRYTEVLVIPKKEIRKYLEQVPLPIREILLQKSQQLHQAISWAENCQQSNDPLLAAAEIIELHAYGHKSPQENVRSVILNYDKITASLVRLCGLIPCQAKLLLQSMEDFNLLHSSGEGANKVLHIESFNLVHRTKKIVKRVGNAITEQLRAENEHIDLENLCQLVATEQEQILAMLSSGELPIDILMFRKPAILALIEAKGKDVFQKRKKKAIQDWECIADLCFANNRILQEVIEAHTPYTLAVLLQALDEKTSQRILSLLSARRRKILQSAADNMQECDEMEIASIGEEVIFEIKKRHVAKQSELDK